MVWLFLALAIISEVIATVFLRMSDGFTKKKWIVPILASYGTAILFLTLALQEGMAIGIAYGIWAATGIALTAIVARILFKDPLTRKMSLGIGLIIIGVLLVELGAGH